MNVGYVVWFRGAVVAFVVLATACVLGHATLVRRDQFGGTLALKGHHGAAMENAQEQMAVHCQGPYTIVSEEQIVVGEQTHTRQGQSYGRRSTYAAGSQTTTQVTEYHVTYACGAQVQAAPAPSGVMQPAANPAGVQ